VEGGNGRRERAAGEELTATDLLHEGELNQNLGVTKSSVAGQVESAA